MNSNSKNFSDSEDDSVSAKVDVNLTPESATNESRHDLRNLLTALQEFAVSTASYRSEIKDVI